ncbi:FAD-dependent monooxygenase [Bradyrhizobium canariense]|uniref:Putative polyketide hydroxylase n=1 Tax=Bradyrhizobium canariense TaxID=255045 RepID=A0A1H2BTN9_9BRAD|nr:FAD-dependent monooxygenase [Bradyrhizobium canariense]SDT61126.1 putative polyketide hydroxylase [Bradyrhizobium canariense]
MLDTPVLISGGGPVGLTASLLLSQHGVRSLLVERHPGTAVTPKARGINARTMEIFRQYGIDAAIRDAGLAEGGTGLIVWVETLAGKEIERRVPGRTTAKNLAVTPVKNCLCAQDDLEPVIRRFAESAGPGTLRFNTEMTSFSQRPDAVTGLLTDRTTGAETPFTARYLIAAEGAQSRVRRALSVKMIGEEEVYDSVNILFHADLTQWVEHRPAALYFVEQPDLRGTFLTINGRDRWGFLIHSPKQYGWRPQDFTPEFCTELIRKAAGVQDLAVSVLRVNPWQASAIVADRYRVGNVFLAGDAAHEMPPTGGFGLNTGVQDVHNLTWKIAAVLQGQADESLLDSYHAERQPFGQIVTQNSLTNAMSMGRAARQSNVLPRREFLNEQGLIFGACYQSTAVVPDDTPPAAVDDPVTEYVPSARPGSRAPHVWLRRGSEQISTIDLFGSHFVLLAGRDGDAWCQAAREIGASRPSLVAYAIGHDESLIDADGNWHSAYGVDTDGVVLVRPDGYVAWRSRTSASNPLDALRTALDGLLGRMPAMA